jgi:uncharacterized NAD(P)/FAD-binding protein YdhS
MSVEGLPGSRPTLAIIGGGFAGSLLALKLVAAGHIQPLLIEQRRQAGAGLAFGDSARDHVLNVPVARMDVGLTPSFEAWLATLPSETAQAVAESGELAQAFVPRALFGRYLRQQVELATASGRLLRIKGEVTELKKQGMTCELTLKDGRRLKIDQVVLATGNEPPKAPDLIDEEGRELTDSHLFVADPWAREAFAGLSPQDPILLIGTGLTMTDTALALANHGHEGPIYTISRRGLLPNSHLSGGTWSTFLEGSIGHSPATILRRMRQEVRAASSQAVPWQRVIDAARPQLAQMWAAWTRAQRAQFLRHARPFWDVHRHRVAPRIAYALQTLVDRGQLISMRGRLRRFASQEGLLDISYAVRGTCEIHNLKVARVFNCTGPRTDYGSMGSPLFVDLRRQGLISPDPLGLGLETQNARLIDAYGRVSETLFAVGSLTRPAWWEITAVPEIAAQVSRLAETLHQPEDIAHQKPSLAFDFFDLGAGI